MSGLSIYLSVYPFYDIPSGYRSFIRSHNNFVYFDQPLPTMPPLRPRYMYRADVPCSPQLGQRKYNAARGGSRSKGVGSTI